jgi:hypothetical protein
MAEQLVHVPMRIPVAADDKAATIDVDVGLVAADRDVQPGLGSGFAEAGRDCGVASKSFEKSDCRSRHSNMAIHVITVFQARNQGGSKHCVCRIAVKQSALRRGRHE